jgi:putative oxidoreductase
MSVSIQYLAQDVGKLYHQISGNDPSTISPMIKEREKVNFQLQSPWSPLMFDLEAWSPRVLAAVRIVSALLFIEHGLMKLLAFPAAVPGLPTPLPGILVAAAAIEVIGGALIAAGLLTRAAAVICSGEMAVAYFMFHAPQSFWPAVNQGDAAILFCFVFLYLAFAGAGAWSLDALFSRAQRLVRA